MTRFIKLFDVSSQTQISDVNMCILKDILLHGNLPKIESVDAKTRMKDNDDRPYLDYFINGKLYETFGFAVSDGVFMPDVASLAEVNKLAETMFREETIYGVKDSRKLEAILNSVSAEYFGVATYSGVVNKAAAIWHKIADAQSFQNGNKRTALLSGLFVLGMNGFELENTLGNEMYDISLKIANKEMDQEDVAMFIRSRLSIKFYESFEQAASPDTSFEVKMKLDKPK